MIWTTQIIIKCKYIREWALNLLRPPLLTVYHFVNALTGKSIIYHVSIYLLSSKNLKCLRIVFPQGIEILHFSKLILTYLTEMMITKKITLLKVLRQYAIWKKKMLVKMISIQNWFKNSGREKQLPFLAGIYWNK